MKFSLILGYLAFASLLTSCSLGGKSEEVKVRVLELETQLNKRKELTYYESSVRPLDIFLYSMLERYDLSKLEKSEQFIVCESILSNLQGYYGRDDIFVGEYAEGVTYSLRKFLEKAPDDVLSNLLSKLKFERAKMLLTKLTSEWGQIRR